MTETTWKIIEFKPSNDGGLTSFIAPEGHDGYHGAGVDCRSFVITQPLEYGDNLMGSFVGAHVAKIEMAYGTDGRQKALVNARLIAAAPELLDACRKAAAALRWLEENEVAGDVDLAIAKATRNDNILKKKILSPGLSHGENFANTMRYAVNQGLVDVNVSTFRGWHDNCNCASCRSQRIIYDFLFPNETPEPDCDVNRYERHAPNETLHHRS